ncbi:MAG: hypothetical protein ABIH50_01840 [bacterium]
MQWLNVKNNKFISFVIVVALASTLTVTGETVIHLPSTAKRVIIEKQNYSTARFEQEIRAYTIQQAVFWTIATIALGAAIDTWAKK